MEGIDKLTPHRAATAVPGLPQAAWLAPAHARWAAAPNRRRVGRVRDRAADWTSYRSARWKQQPVANDQPSRCLSQQRRLAWRLRRIEAGRDFDAETLARLIRTLEEIW